MVRFVTAGALQSMGLHGRRRRESVDRALEIWVSCAYYITSSSKNAACKNQPNTALPSVCIMIILMVPGKDQVQSVENTAPGSPSSLLNK